MKIGIGDGDAIRNGDALANRNSLGTHEDGTHKNRVITYFENACWFDIKRGPCVHANAIAENKAGRALASKAPETVASLEVAIPADANIGRQVFVRPLARNLTNVHHSP